MYRVTVQAGSWRAELEVEFSPDRARYMPRTHDVRFSSSPHETGQVRYSWCPLPRMTSWGIPFALYHALCHGDYVEAEILSVVKV